MRRWRRRSRRITPASPVTIARQNCSLSLTPSIPERRARPLSSCASEAPGRRIVSRLEIRDLSEPEAVVTYALGATSQVRLAGTVVSHHVLQPGWRWETHAQSEVGTASCELHHRGVVLRGRMGVRTDDGEEAVIGPNQVFDLPPGHFTWVEGDDELVMVDWAGGAGFDVRPGERTRVMATVLFTDMVGSTEQARKAGDAA
jgi:hypothetical protein